MLSGEDNDHVNVIDQQIKQELKYFGLKWFTKRGVNKTLI